MVLAFGADQVSVAVPASSTLSPTLWYRISAGATFKAEPIAVLTFTFVSAL
jgi:hypothetical protein